jgi:hypothetical protein
LIVDAILGEVYGGREPVPEESHQIPIEKVPANLKKFFAAMRAQEEQQTEASVCGPSCCGPAPTEEAAAPIEAAAGTCCGPAQPEPAADPHPASQLPAPLADSHPPSQLPAPLADPHPPSRLPAPAVDPLLPRLPVLAPALPLSRAAPRP